MPMLAILLGLAGLIPFIVCGLGAISADTGQAARMLVALVGYGAVILSFLGGVHWGFALTQAAPLVAPDITPVGARLAGGQRARLALGVLPALIGWAALLVAMVLPDWTALVVLIAGFVGTVVVEHQAGRHMLVQPAGYLWLRWGLTIVVVAMLVTVLVLRLLGPRIVLW
jgi:hypothetical protein